MTNRTSLPKLACLGPLGTYSHQAAYERFGAAVEYCAKDTIADTFSALSRDTPIAFVPRENSIFGTVTETYDLLRQPAAGADTFVRGEATLAVRHCLVVRKGTPLAAVTRVLSHEQALGQCARFLARTLPGAARVKMPSTAAAAQALLGADGACSAAICSRVCETVFADLAVLREGIQDEDRNFTKFFIMAGSLDAPLPVPDAHAHARGRRRHALLRISCARPATAGPTADAGPRTEKTPTIAQLLGALTLPVLQIDRRPALDGAPFQGIYFVEVGSASSNGDGDEDEDTPADDAAWRARVAEQLAHIAHDGGHAQILGVW